MYMETISSPQIIQQTINQVEPVISQINSSLFNKIFEYKYLIILLILIILCFLYYHYKFKPKQEIFIAQNKPIIQDFIVADINGKVIKISGEQVGELKLQSTGQSTTGHSTTGHSTTGHSTTGHSTTGHSTTGQSMGQSTGQNTKSGQSNQNKISKTNFQEEFQEETSEENNNIKQHDLTNSEIKEITNKLKN
jgi:hypothetical protein